MLTITLPRPDPGFPEDFVITYTYDNFELVEGKELVYITEEDPNEGVTKYYYDEFDLESLEASKLVWDHFGTIWMQKVLK